MTFLRNLRQDINYGRESWRVLITCSTVSLVASVALTFARNPF